MLRDILSVPSTLVVCECARLNRWIDEGGVLHGGSTAAERAQSAEEAALKAKLRMKVEQAEKGRSAVTKDKKKNGKK